MSYRYKIFPINFAVSKWQYVVKGFTSLTRWQCEHLHLNWLVVNHPAELEVQVASYRLSIKSASMGPGIVKNKRPWACKQKTHISTTIISNRLCPPERHLAAHDCSCVKISTESSSNLCPHTDTQKQIEEECCLRPWSLWECTMQQWKINLLLRNYPYLVLIMKEKIFTLWRLYTSLIPTPC